MKKIDKKAFTLIEVIVVVAIIGILVLLAVPRFIGHSQRAEDARVQHDVKVMEQEIGAMFINGDDDFDNWGNNIKYLNQLVQDNKLFEKKGPVIDPIDGTYKVIPEEYKGKINTKLKGTFYANSRGKVYYEHGKGLGYSDEEIEDLIENQGYIPIATAEELNSIGSNAPRFYGEGTKWKGTYEGELGKHYVQVANIDLSEYEGWESIGTFTGTYDGGNYVITGLKIKSEDKDYQGLFGRTEGATISNVALENINVAGSSYVGGLVGYASKSTISSSYATGSVEGSDEVGGLVGHAKDSTVIINSYATGEVEGRNYVGGLVGWAYINSTITSSYATGSVTGSGVQVGGLVGVATSSVEIINSYSTDSVEGRTDVGGLVGWAGDSTIKNSYATGSVEGIGHSIGGLVGGASSNANISNSYWDNTKTLTTSTIGIGKSTVDMKNQATYTDWDFVNVWEIDEGNDYPKLR